MTSDFLVSILKFLNFVLHLRSYIKALLEASSEPDEHPHKAVKESLKATKAKKKVTTKEAPVAEAKTFDDAVIDSDVSRYLSTNL